MGFDVLPGRPQPLGATPDADGVNFSVFAEGATSIELLLFDKHDSPEPSQVVVMDSKNHHTFYFWHAYVKGCKPGQAYAYRADGPWDPEGRGYRFNRNKVLIDPYSRANTDTLWERASGTTDEDNVRTSMRSIVVDLGNYDWEGDEHPRTPMADSVIYEVHVRGLTASPTSGSRNAGTFSAVKDKIGYLKRLGVTAIELLPIYEYDELEVMRQNPLDGSDLRNYWGYDPYGYFAPQVAYCVDGTHGEQVDEFRDMVKALHAEGIEVILDVVYNHTSEGNHLGPTMSFRGLANHVYYHLVPHDKQFYMDYTGCGNTVNANHPVVAKMITESLEYWVKEHHVDGFRFDLASTLSRSTDGSPSASAPVPWNIDLSGELAETKIIAEAWDAAGLYQVGHFPGSRWAEWNGRYRDDVRKFVKGEPGLVGDIATRLSGSSDMYQDAGEGPTNSVNFITAHDGFTLNDLVSYNDKHNEANGEDNRDGANDNNSWNCGVEGDTDDPEVEHLRERQIRNFCTILMLSQGVPMVLGGDEFRRTQKGNNNAYCQDNELTWFDWNLAEKNDAMVRFFSEMIAFRKRHGILRRRHFFESAANERNLLDVAWHGTELYAPGFNDPNARVLQMTLGAQGDDADVHAIFNMYWEPVAFALPPVEGRRWHRAVDTFRPAPADIVDPGKEEPVDADRLTVEGRSVVVLISK